MQKILILILLVLSSLAIKLQITPYHDQTWIDTTILNAQQQPWDTYYRNTIRAIGSSQLKQVATGPNGQVQLRYLDTTGANNQTTAWEITGNNDPNNKTVQKIVQVKTIPDVNNPYINTITKTTFQNVNLLDVSKQLYTT